MLMISEHGFHSLIHVGFGPCRTCCYLQKQVKTYTYSTYIICTRYINLDKRKQIPINYTCNIYIKTKEEQLLYTFGSTDLTPWLIFILLKDYRSS